MAVYPPKISLYPYRGRDPRKLEKRRKDRMIANAIEEYVNTEFTTLMAHDHTHSAFDYDSIAGAIGENERTVSRLMLETDGVSGIIITFPKHKSPPY
ncbi:hypothetical protein [Nitratidesulfovibrio sp.]|uniref:hypothetical protein n=1 Tax=Nitratidesulfovibrio sp. TaxID=2802297 RepID=UPI00333F473C